MTEDRFALKLGNEISNMKLIGKNATVFPVINILSLCLRNNMHVFVPTKKPEAVKRAENEGRKLRPDEMVKVEFLQIRSNTDDMFYAPVFTSLEEAKKGQNVPLFKYPLKPMLDTIDNHPKCKGIIVNPWSTKFVITREIAKSIGNFTPHAALNIVKADPMLLKCDAIVNDTDKTLFGENDLNKSVIETAGPELLDKIWTLQGCKEGEAKITSSYDMENTDFIIHTVSPLYNGDIESRQKLASCYVSALDIAYERGFTSIVFPCIGSVSKKFPLDISSVISINTIMRWIRVHQGAVINVYIACKTSDELSAYAKIAKEHQSRQDMGDNS